MRTTSKKPFGVRVQTTVDRKLEEAIRKAPSLTKSRIGAAAVAYFVQTGQLDRLVEQESLKDRTPA